MTVFEISLLVEIFIGFTIQALFLLLLSYLNKRYYSNLLEITIAQTARNTLLLLGKMDETTDASSITLTEATRTSAKITDVAQDVKATKEMVISQSQKSA
jgi:hypothetical protein